MQHVQRQVFSRARGERTPPLLLFHFLSFLSFFSFFREERVRQYVFIDLFVYSRKFIDRLPPTPSDVLLHIYIPHLLININYPETPLDGWMDRSRATTSGGGSVYMVLLTFLVFCYLRVIDLLAGQVDGWMASCAEIYIYISIHPLLIPHFFPRWMDIYTPDHLSILGLILLSSSTSYHIILNHIIPLQKPIIPACLPITFTYCL